MVTHGTCDYYETIATNNEDSMSMIGVSADGCRHERGQNPETKTSRNMMLMHTLQCGKFNTWTTRETIDGTVNLISQVSPFKH